MTRIVGIHEVELKPGVTGEEFAEAVHAFALADQSEGPNGWVISVIKSDRGTQLGGYGILFEIESVETRDRWISDDGITEMHQQFAARHPEYFSAWEHIQSLIVQPNQWNDYLVL